MATITTPRACLAALAAALLVTAGQAWAGSDEDAGKVDRSQYTEMSPKELAEHLIFDREGFAIHDKTQEGGTVADRLRQDKLQETCSGVEAGDMDKATAKKVKRMARNSLEYPDGGVELGDWQEGQKVAENAFGYRIGHKVDDHSQREPGGLCINCHTLEADKAHRSGTVGPSLVDYGDQRGRTEAMIKYTYEVVYNVHTAFPCAQMPRLGANDILTQEQISDVLAYLLDPESPVNKE
jgi:sulfur-oxidizing protein SoxX